MCEPTFTVILKTGVSFQSRLAKHDAWMRERITIVLTENSTHAFNVSDIYSGGSRSSSRRGRFLGGRISRVIFRTWIMMLILYRHPSEAKVSDYCFPSVYFFYSPFMLRNYSTDFRKIFRNIIVYSGVVLNPRCNIKTGLNYPIVLKLFRRHLVEIVLTLKKQNKQS